MEFNERLKKVRSIMGLTQVEFAKLGGVKAVTQTNYERGLRFPTLEYLLKLKTAGVDIHFVVFGEVQEQGALSAMESKLLLAYRNGEFERKKAIEFVAGIHDDDNAKGNKEDDISSHHLEVKEDKKKTDTNLCSTYYLGDVGRNAFNFAFKVMPVISIMIMLFLSFIYILTNAFMPMFSVNSLLANVGNLGIAVSAFILIIGLSIKFGEKLLNYKDSNLVRLRQLRALFAK